MSQPPPHLLEPLNYSSEPPPLNLRAIALRQKVIQFCILAEILLFIIPFLGASDVAALASMLLLGVTIAAAVVAVLLCIEMRFSIVSAILLGLVVLLPIVGMFTLLLIDIQATKRLRKSGISVGLLGAKRIPPP